MSHSPTADPSEFVQQAITWAALSLAAAGCVAILSWSHREAFAPYLGSIPPLAAIVLVIGVGGICLAMLYTRAGFMVIDWPQTVRGIVISAAIVAIFAIEVTLLDLRVPFAADINVPLPQSLLFYPAIAYAAEIMFHVLPLTVLLLALNMLAGALSLDSISFETIVWISIVGAATLETTYQLRFANSASTSTLVYMWLRLFLFSLVQLAIFRRYDFVSMLSFRLMYYAYWHIIWGTLRLHILY